MFIDCIPLISSFLNSFEICNLLVSSKEILDLYNLSVTFIYNINKFNYNFNVDNYSVLKLCKRNYISKYVHQRYIWKNNVYRTPNPVSIYEVFYYVCRKCKIDYNIWDKMNKTSLIHNKKIYGYTFHCLNKLEMNNLIDEILLHYKNK